ncbi:hypothetical protein H0H92_010602 [Tricholoma furcatifolium]|nr:hypothetical protein H0H92_010602 [Tricholoma furcatifolium]
MASIFVDQTSTAIRVYEGGFQNTETSTAFIGSTALQFSGPAIVSLSFNGTAASLYGVLGLVYTIPSQGSSDSIPANVTIDGGKTSKTTATNSSTLGLLYTTPTLSDGPHTVDISMSPVSGIIDYMVVTGGNDTQLLGQQLIIDDDDTSVSYEGTWTKNQSTLLNKDDLVRSPYGDGIHQTSSSGAAVTLTFNGTAIAVYGPSSPGPSSADLQINYTLDAVNSQIVDYTDSLLLNSNFQWYLNDTLAPGEHTLRMEVIKAVNANFTIDYALYSPSFNTLETPGSTSSGGSRVVSVGPTVRGMVVAGILMMFVMSGIFVV